MATGIRLPDLPNYYPRSFLKLIIAGFLLVALPLIFAIVNNAFSIHEIVKRSQRTVHQAVEATKTSGVLIEQVKLMERSVRQYTVMRDTALLEGYEVARKKFAETTTKLSGLQLAADQSGELKMLKLRESELAQAVDSARGNPAALETLQNEFTALLARSQALDDLGTEVVEREVAQLQNIAESVQRFVFWQLVALVPVALFLIVAAIILISRPISQIDAAIRRMGEGNFDARIEVKGPQDLQHLGRQLEWMRVKLIDLEEQKMRFLRHVSHELKTPLASLKEGVDLLEDEVVGQLSPAQREVAAILKQATNRLQRLIEDMLSYHSAQFQRTAVTISPVPVVDLVARAAQHHRLTMAAKSLRFQVDCPSIVIEADRDKLAAIVDNLVSNAVKYSPPGGRVNVEAKTEEQIVTLDVVDQGPGIAAEERERVFEPFYQGRAQYTGPVKGTGLGLAIVKEFVTAHHGTIEIVDQPERGTRMRVRLPLSQKQWATA